MKATYVVAALTLVALLSFTPAAEAQRTVTVKAVGTGGNFAWDPTTITAQAGENLTISWAYGEGTDTNAPHNFHVKELKKKTNITTSPTAEKDFVTVAFDGTTLTYVCDIHPTMTGKIMTQSTGNNNQGGTPTPTKTPGFEAVFVAVAALGLALVIRRKSA
jgi:plastocyanin